MKMHVLGSFILLSAIALLAGCHGSGDSAATTQSVPIPPDSIFAKVTVGMSKDDVFAKIGQPTNIGAYQTGKAWIPFHFSGSDDVRLAAHYKGAGIIIFSNDSAYTSGYSVSEIDYNPNEPGY
jgi:hypothetical protein